MYWLNKHIEHGATVVRASKEYRWWLLNEPGNVTGVERARQAFDDAVDTLVSFEAERAVYLEVDDETI